MTLTAPEIDAGRRNDRIGKELVLQTDKMRVWHMRLAPGEAIAPHRHDRPYFWTALTDGEGVSRFDDGRTVTSHYKAGDTKHFPHLNAQNAFVHDLTNTGSDELVFVTVEFTPEANGSADRTDSSQRTSPC